MNTVNTLSENSGKTAIKRYSFSRPVIYLLENNLLNFEKKLRRELLNGVTLKKTNAKHNKEIDRFLTCDA